MQTALFKETCIDLNYHDERGTHVIEGEGGNRRGLDGRLRYITRTIYTHIYTTTMAVAIILLNIATSFFSLIRRVKI